MKRPRNTTRDITDKHLRRVAKALGYQGRSLPLSSATVLIHPQHPRGVVWLYYEGRETRREAAERLRVWAWGQ